MPVRKRKLKKKLKMERSKTVNDVNLILNCVMQLNRKVMTLYCENSFTTVLPVAGIKKQNI